MTTKIQTLEQSCWNRRDTCNVSILGKNLQVANSSDSQAVGGDVK